MLVAAPDEPGAGELAQAGKADVAGDRLVEQQALALALLRCQADSLRRALPSTVTLPADALRAP
jgi:hypothetical protein